MAQAKKTTTAKKKTTTAKRSKAPAKTEPFQRSASLENYTARYTMALVCLLFACFTFVSYFVNDGAIIVGIKEFISGVLGYGYWAFGVCLIWAAVILFKGGEMHTLRTACVFMIPVLFSAFIDVITFTPVPKGQAITDTVNRLFIDGQNFRCGGVFSGMIVVTMVALLSRVGTGIIVAVFSIVSVILAITEPHGQIFGTEPKKAKKAAAMKAAAEPRERRFSASDLIRMVDREDPINDPIEEQMAPPVKETKKSASSRKRFVSDIPLGEEEDDALTLKDSSARRTSAVRGETGRDYSKSVRAARAAADELEDRQISKRFAMPREERETAEPAGLRKPAVNRDARRPARRPVPVEPATEKVKPISIDEAAKIAGVELETPVKSDEAEKPKNSVSIRRAAAAAGKADIKTEHISKADVQKEAKAVAAAISADTGTGEYTYPIPSLLNKPQPAGADSQQELIHTRDLLESSLHSFGINSEVVNITNGPTVTRYDIVLEQGVKLTKVTNLSSDIALSLGVSNVRIAPIPDEISTVGIEVPNKIVNTVGLRDIIESDNFTKAKSRLTFAIGKDIAGNAIVGNISKLPHMLIAGTTGSGKSVCMNSLILSLLYKSRPDEVKFIMIDPKMVELGIYNSIPHLYVPVVTDPKKAAGALQWAVVEMLKRYRLFSEAGVRDLESYNAICRANGEPALPSVVIVIDELADLMMIASKEVEESICRIAQMGRASAMHLIIATQRPSADVITGLMKANIPSRIAFAVSSTLESRIILDQGGADKLIGHGDMLYAPIGCGKPMRVQGAFVSDDERESIIKYISDNSTYSQEKNEEIQQFMDKATEAKGGSSDSSSSSDKEDKGLAGEYDDMLPQAAEVVLEIKQCSVSMLQRRLKLGYSRAARIVDQMEELGIVGPYEGAKPRSVPIDREGWNRIQVQLGLASEDDFALAAEMSEEADGEEDITE